MGVPIALFSARDVGCIADGSFGHAHVRMRLSELCEYYGADAYAAELRREMSDDASEEYDAIEFLNRHCCKPGVYFELHDGDLVLCADDPAEADPDSAFEKSQDR